MTTISNRLTIDNNHIYRLDGAVIPGVSEILKNAGIIDVRFYNEWHANRGTQIHRGCALILNQQLDWSTVDREIAGCLGTFEAFVRQSGVKPVAIEQPVYRETPRYAGTPDLVGEINGQTVLIDYKSGAAVPEWAGYQLAAYAGCFEDGYIQKRFVLHLKPNGQFRLNEYRDSSDWYIFNGLAQLENENRRKQNEQASIA